MLMVNKGNGINTDPVRYLEFSGVPKPRELARYCKFPTVTSDSVPSSIPLSKEGIFLTAVPINLIDGKYDLLFSDAKPWSNSKRIVGVEMTGKAVGHHAEYYGMTDKALLKRQSAKAGAVAIKRRTTHYRGMITKTLFTMDANPYGVIVVQLTDGWRDSLLESTSAPYLPRPICQNIREKTQGVLMDSDEVRARVVRDTSVLPTRQQVFNAARNVPRIKDMRGRKPFTDWPRLFVQLKRGGVADNQENIESVSMESRLNGLHGLSTVTSNGVEAINKQVKIWTQGSRDLPECADLLESRMLNIDRDLADAVSGKGTEIACPRSIGMEPSKAARVFGTASTCTDILDMIPMFKDLEAVIGYKYLNQLRMKAVSLRIFKWSDEAFSVYDDEEKVCYSVNTGRKQSCVCRASRSLCSHVLCVWGSLDRGRAQSLVEDYLNAKQVQTQQDQFAEFGFGSKNGKKRRRGVESTRRRTNTRIAKFVSNPYASASEDGDSDASFLSMDADIAEGDLIGQLASAIDTSFPK